MEMERSTKEVFGAINTASSHIFVDSIEGGWFLDLIRDQKMYKTQMWYAKKATYVIVNESRIK